MRTTTTRLRLVGVLLAAAVAVGEAKRRDSYVCSNTTTVPTVPGVITGTQGFGNSTAYSGAPFTPQKLAPKLTFAPPAALMHGDGGNTGVTDFPGPLGKPAAALTTARQVVAVQLWGDDGKLTTATLDPNSTTDNPVIGLAATDPTTLALLSAWFPPASDGDQTLNVGYMEMRQRDKTVVVTTQQGQIYAVRRTECPTGPQLHAVGSYNVSSYLSPGETLLTAMYDIDGNIWFATGFVINATGLPQPSTTVGYVPADGGTPRVMHIADQMGENGIAVSGSKVFMVTGPSNTSTNGTGYMWSLCASPAGVETRWSLPYDSGPGRKLGGWSRGSGTTPVLLGDDFVIITDNADPQVHLLVLHQDPQPHGHGGGSSQVACTADMFDAGAGAVDISPTVQYDPVRRAYDVTAINGYNVPPFFRPTTLAVINGPGNDMSAMAGGLQRVVVSKAGACSPGWLNRGVRSKSVPLLSTATGLIYYYVQDEDLAPAGDYVWYFAAADWATGTEQWRIRTGAGGLFNDLFFPMSLSPDGRLYQVLPSGAVMMKEATANGTLA